MFINIRLINEYLATLVLIRALVLKASRLLLVPSITIKQKGSREKKSLGSLIALILTISPTASLVGVLSFLNYPLLLSLPP